MKLRAIFNNPDSFLLPGMYVSAIIEEGIVDNTILIPQRSVMANNTGGHTVFLLEKEEKDDSTQKMEYTQFLDFKDGSRGLGGGQFLGDADVF